MSYGTKPTGKPAGNRELLIVGFCGKAKSGKDSAAQAISSLLKSKGIFVRQMAFADPIRKIGRIFDFPEICLTDQDLKENWMHPYLSGITPRKFMQLVGSEMFRNNLDKDVWVKHLVHKIKCIDEDLVETETRKLHSFTPSDSVKWSPKGVVLITDVRFPNEAKAIRDLGGCIVKVNRLSICNGDDNEWRNHESEKFIDDLTVDTNSTNDIDSLFHWQAMAISWFADWTKNVLKISFDNSTWHDITPM